MAKTNLNKMSLEELKALEKDVANAITSFEKRQRDDARAAIEATAKEHGFKLSDLVAGGKSAKPAAVAKYRHPENPALTWSGRGRKPNWLVEATAAGKSPEDFLITN